MLLRALELESIRSYRRARIEFPVGRTLLSGDIGAGKSTILLAVEFALFGLVRGWNDGDKLLRHGATSGRVRLEADIAGPLIIERSLKRSSSGVQQEDVTIIDDAGERRITPSEARSLIVERLGYPPEFATKQPILFRYTIFTPQETMKQIVDERPEVRLDAVRKIFGIDRYDLVAGNAQTIARQIKQRSAVLSGRLERKTRVIDELAELKGHAKTLDAEIETKRSLRVEAREALTAAAEELEAARSAIEREKAKRELAERIRDERAELEAELESLIAERAQLPTRSTEQATSPDVHAIELELGSLDERIAELEADLTKVRDERAERDRFDYQLRVKAERAAESIAELEAAMQEREKGLASLAPEIERFRRFDAKAVGEERDRLDATLEELSAERVRFAERASAAEERITSMPETGECPLCGQPIDAEHRSEVLTELRGRVTHASERIAAIETRMTEAREKRLALDERLERHAKLEERRAQLPEDRSEELGKGREILAKLTSNREQLAGKLEILGERLETVAEARTTAGEARQALARRLRDARELELRLEREKRAAERSKAIETRITSIRARQEKLQAEVPMIDPKARARLETATAEHARALKAEAEASASFERVRERRTGLAEREERLGSELEALRALEAEREGLSRIAAFLTGPVPDVAAQIESAVMRRILVETNDRFSKWFSVLVEDLEAYLDDRFSPRIVQSGFDVSFDDLSGGERTSVALAFRLALHEAINHLTGQSSTGLLILDEPTEGFSTEQLDAVRNVLSQLRSEQIILVSHEEKVESFVDHTIRIEKREQESVIP